MSATTTYTTISSTTSAQTVQAGHHAELTSTSTFSPPSSTMAAISTTTTTTTTAAAAAATTSTSSMSSTMLSSTSMPMSSTTPLHEQPHQSSLLPQPPQVPPKPNTSPITIYSAPPRPFRPDRLATIDLIIVVVYICLLLSTSISTMIRTKKSMKRKARLAASRAGGSPAAAAAAAAAAGGNNFLASGRKMSWFTVGLSIFASNLGSEHFIGLSGSAAANGISVAAFEMNALLILQLATWIFLPVLIVSKISTLPEYMSKRFGGKRIRTYLAVLSILLYIFTKISVNLFSGGIFIQQAIGWNLYTSAMFILALTSVMTLTGGLKGAMVIDNLQAIVMTIGASIVSIRALVAIGGWEGLKHKYSLAVPSKVPQNLTLCAQPNARAFQMLRPSNDNNMPWIGFIIGQTPASIWYWAADQMMVQRFLSARSLAHVQGASVFAGYLKILPLVFMVIPGMISRCLYTDEVGCIDPEECQKYCQSSVSCSNTAYPRLVLELMPMGARGMMVAAMVAALMGDLCNVFNSASALFSCDIWPLFRKHATQQEQETAGRVFVIFLVVASIMWIPAIQEMQGGQLFIYIQAVAAMFAPPIAGVYICAVLWMRSNETGAFWSLMFGFALGFLRMVMAFMYKEPSCGQQIDDRPWLLKDVHYMYYAAFLFWATIACNVCISSLTKPPAPFRLIRTTYWTRYDTNIRKDDKNVFEMKYTNSITTSGSRLSQTNSSSTNALVASASVSTNMTTLSDAQRSTTTSGDDVASSSGKSSQQRLFTIDERQERDAAVVPAAVDLSSVIVDINAAATLPADTTKQPTSPRPTLHHQSSLRGLANKLASTDINLKGAKDMVLAAASHLTGGNVAPASRIKFTNLTSGEEDDDDDDALFNESTVDDDDDDDDVENGDEDDEDSDATLRKAKGRRAAPRRTQSVMSAAISSYKSKQRAGYKKALVNDDDGDEDDDDDDDDDDDERSNLNRSSSRKRRLDSSSLAAGGGGGGSSAGTVAGSARAPIGAKKATVHNKKAQLGASAAAEQSCSSGNDDRLTPTQRLVRDGDKSTNAKGKLRRSRRANSAKAARSKRADASKKAGLYEEDDDYDNQDQELGRTYRCLDNSVALLIKTRFEETMLRIALIAIIFVAIGIFVLLSLPPDLPTKELIDMLDVPRMNSST